MSLSSENFDKHFMLDDLDNKLKRKPNWYFKSARNEDDKRARREVANNNERRRMQSINAGFENLRKLLPHCVDNDKISKASILQTTSKYINELKMRINCLENDLLRSNLEHNKSNLSKAVDDVQNDFTDTFLKNVIEDTYRHHDTNKASISGYVSDLGSSSSSLTTEHLSSSMTSLKSCDNDQTVTFTNCSRIITESLSGCFQPQNSLEHLLAAVAQVEREEVLQAINATISDLPTVDENRSESATSNSSTTFSVMKPMISPFAEEIIQGAVNMQKAQSESSGRSIETADRSPKLAIPHKYLHRPKAVLNGSNK